MLKNKKLLFMLLIFCLKLSYVNALEMDDLGDLNARISGAIIAFTIVIVSWSILAYYLLKSEPKAINVNMADRYKDISSQELLSFDIDSIELKKNICKKFKDIHTAISKVDYDKLKLYLTDDLYKNYVDELKKMHNNGYRNIMDDFEIMNVKVYDINNSYGVISVLIYLNVRMYDYVVDVNTKELVSGNNNEKMDFEFELTFIKNNSNYVMSRKSCINKMEINKDKKVK